MALNINGTTGISGVDGSVSAPPLAGTDSNTGISFGSDTIKLSTGGVERMAITNSGVSATGHILQVIQTLKSDEFSFTTTGVSTFVALTGLTVTITPQSASNKILVSGFVSFNMANASQNALRLKRDSTVIGSGTESNAVQALAVGTSNTDRYHPYPFEILDSPNTTSAITYSLEMAKSQSGTLRINRRDTSSSSGFSASSAITVMEVAA